MKKQKVLITLIIISIFVIFIVLALVMLVKKSVSNNNNIVKNINCLEKGKVCTTSDIISGIKMDLKVNDNDTFTFNVLASDENTITLLLNKNVDFTTDWDETLRNSNGPYSLLYALNDLSNKWNNIPLIKEFKYDDFGYLDFNNRYPNAEKDIYYYIGYKNIAIKDGILTLTSNINVNLIEGIELKDIKTIDDYKLNMRSVTIDELNILKVNNKYPDWIYSNLSSNQGYWTLSSSTEDDMTYTKAAYAVVNDNGNTIVKSVLTANSFNDIKIGLRPVIIINK